MKQIELKTDLSCKRCIAKVEPLLKSNIDIIDYEVDLEHPDRLVTITSNSINIDEIIAVFNTVGYKAEKQ